MLATAATPPDSPPLGPDWRYEVKWDGVRVLADTTAGRLRLLGRNGRDAMAAYPELRALDALPGAVLDGEVVAMRDGAPSFAALAERMHVQDPARAERLAARVPISYVVFDVVSLYGVDLSGSALDERRATLDRLDLPMPVTLSPVYDDGALLWSATRDQGLEGVVAKRGGSTYQPGRRSPDWIKAVHRATRTALVCGWRPESTGSGRLGALLLAAPGPAGELRYLGRAGSGLTGAVATELTRRLGPLTREQSPLAEPVPPIDARGTVWVHPELLVDVRYLARTPAGRLRHPVIRGLREDTTVDPWEQR
ncbi:non-homologous end-joining DNA ligase [Cellulomonas sp. NPDC089187]|uniref:non-homologous end-joining DNA ligase n=1 Tax=Cellulomonas sp. NPDC089187 TaxID=3154970 RepID=UPI00342406CF